MATQTQDTEKALTTTATAEISKEERKAPVGYGRAGVILTSLAELWRFAQLASESELAPKGLDTPQKVAIAIQYGAEFGVPPMAALRSIRVINGIPGWMGDMALGIVRASGKMEDFESFYEGDGETRTAVVVSKRKDAPKPKRTEFSVKDAKTARLWGKDQTPWVTYPDRMLYYRALGFNLRDNFPDVMAGAVIAEELADVPVHEMRSVGAGSTQRAALAAAPSVRDPLLEQIGAVAPSVEMAAVPAMPAEAPAATEPICLHLNSKAAKPGRTPVCPDCGEILSDEKLAPCCGQPHGPSEPCPKEGGAPERN